jgi:hypothetical protein
MGEWVLVPGLVDAPVLMGEVKPVRLAAMRRRRGRPGGLRLTGRWSMLGRRPEPAVRYTRSE